MCFWEVFYRTVQSLHILIARTNLASQTRESLLVSLISQLLLALCGPLWPWSLHRGVAQLGSTQQVPSFHTCSKGEGTTAGTF
jgi:hypothetical protein